MSADLHGNSGDSRLTSGFVRNTVRDNGDIRGVSLVGGRVTFYGNYVIYRGVNEYIVGSSIGTVVRGMLRTSIVY